MKKDNFNDDEIYDEISEDNDEKKKSHSKHRRGRRKKKKGGISNIITTIILILAVCVFCYSGYNLYKIFNGYHQGEKEYKQVKNLAVKTDEEGKFRVDFDKLTKINKDTIAWIRFYKEPSIISYPVVQTDNNDYYLHNTFSANENTLGAIFMDYRNSAGFTDTNSVIYGHRMKDGSMFRHLQDYDDKSFYKKNPYFYIYTPDNKELTYQIFSYGQIEDDSKTYQVQFSNDEERQQVINLMMKESAYDTGVKAPTVKDKIVTLSTCTSASDEHRIVVHGKLIKTVDLN